MLFQVRCARFRIPGVVAHLLRTRQLKILCAKPGSAGELPGGKNMVKEEMK
jgi:hypothetical protein